jgi:hypothetical protein
MPLRQKIVTGLQTDSLYKKLYENFDELKPFDGFAEP